MNPFLACAAVLLFPSCVQWNIGENIREGAQICVGADLRECYDVPDELNVDYNTWPHGGGKSLRILAPEVCFRPDYPLVSTNWKNLPRAKEVQPTGAYRKVTRSMVVIFRGEKAEVGGRCEVPNPAALRRIGSRGIWAEVRPAEPQERKCGKWYPLAAIAAVPFDYVIDPALSVVTTPFFWVGALIARPFCQHTPQPADSPQ